MRKTRDAAKKMSIDDVLNDEEAPLKHTIPDTNPGVFEITEGSRIVDIIMNNGFSPIEKEIVGMLCEGYTAREIGRKLNISHTMVIKHKNHMAERSDVSVACQMSLRVMDEICQSMIWR